MIGVLTYGTATLDVEPSCTDRFLLRNFEREKLGEERSLVLNQYDKVEASGIGCVLVINQRSILITMLFDFSVRQYVRWSHISCRPEICKIWVEDEK